MFSKNKFSALHKILFTMELLSGVPFCLNKKKLRSNGQYLYLNLEMFINVKFPYYVKI